MGNGEGLSLEERITRLEDVEAIKQLKFEYARLCDAGYVGEGVGALFVDDGVWKNQQGWGEFHGPAEIAGFVTAQQPVMAWAHHALFNPVVKISDDGASATATWNSIVLATMVRTDDPNHKDAVFISGGYEDELVKVDGEWKFKLMNSIVHYVSNLDEGWVRQPLRQ